MSEAVIGFTVFTVLCLATKALRLYGVIAAALLAMLFPFVSLVLALACGIAYFMFHNRSN